MKPFVIHFRESIIGKRVLSFLVFSMHKNVISVVDLLFVSYQQGVLILCFLVSRQYEFHAVGIMLLWVFPRFQIMDTMY